MWWFWSLAFAKPLLLQTSAGARVEVLPRTQPDVVEVAIYDNRAYLRRDVASWRDDGMWTARLDDVGGGVEFIVVNLRRSAFVPKVRAVDKRTWEIRLVPGTPDLVPANPVPTIDELLADPPRRPMPLPDRALLPLLGDARTYGLDPTTIRLSPPDPDVSVQYWSVLGSPAPASWDEVERLRSLLLTVKDPPVLGELYRRLGDAHSALAMPREAIYYYGKAVESGGPSPSVLLARADAALRIRNWKVARSSCGDAARLAAANPDRGGEGAEEPGLSFDVDVYEEVLTCLSVLSLATQHPAPALTGRALAAVATRQSSKFLAGDLLLRDGYVEEAWPLVAGAAPYLRGDSRQVAWLAVGDAAVLRGDLETAMAAYQGGGAGRLRDLMAIRQDLVAMSVDGVRRWSSWVPKLIDWGEGGGIAAPDAWFLLAQVHERYSDPASAASALAALWDVHPRGRTSADIGERLVDACGRRVAELARDERDAEVVEAWSSCWRPGLGQFVDDASLLGPVALAFSRLGFEQRALDVQQQLSESLALQGLEDVDSLVRLAQLQLPTEPEQALDTIAYTLKRAPDALQRAQLRLVEGNARAATGDDAGARAAWARVVAPPALAAEARLAAARHALRSGDCRLAVATLGPRLTAGRVEDDVQGDLELRVAQCQVTLGADEEALRFAALAVERTRDERVRAEASWLATAVGVRTGLPVPDALRSDAGAFVLLRAEEEAHRAFLEAGAPGGR